MQKYRISTNIGQENKVTVEINQDYDLLEILSLKFSQKDVYTSLCADYGVVCGRISVNDGFGIPNARVSIFVPLSDEDSLDPVISSLYPYTGTTQRNENNYRYNLLPSRRQHGGHTPTGTFFDQTDILSREEVLEVYEKYYKYTVKTNDAGDFMIWGVPLGKQTLHVDVDLSDIGCFSLRPYDFMRQGMGVDKFKNTYTFAESSDLDALPQIVSFDNTIEVYPFWGNEDLCSIGITRTDFDLSSQGIKIEPKAFLLGGTFTDSGKNSVNKNCAPRRKMGRKCDLRTKTGKIEAIRYTSENQLLDNGLYAPVLENYKIDEDIPDDGSFVLPLPMNMDYVFTNEFGENEITNDPNKGIATSACYRFKFSMDDNGNARKRKSASYLVPNIRDYVNESDKSYYFGLDYSGYPTNAVSNDSEKGMLYSEYGEYNPRDYFYRFTYNKVYTVSSFHSGSYNGPSFTNDRYVGLKEIVPAEEEDCSDIETPPVNFGKKNFTFTLLISDVLLFIEHLLNLFTLTLANSLVKILFTIGDAADFRPIRTLARSIKRAAFNIQEYSQKQLFLITYPECEECNPENNQYGTQTPETSSLLYCSVGSMDISGGTEGSKRFDFYSAAHTWTPIQHNLGTNHPTVQVFVYNSDFGVYQEWLDYDFPNDPGTANTFWKSDITNSGFTINFTIDSTGNPLELSGYVIVSTNQTSDKIITNLSYFTSAVCPIGTNGTPRLIEGTTLSEKNDDFILNQELYGVQSGTKIINLSTAGSVYFSKNILGDLVIIDLSGEFSNGNSYTLTIVDLSTVSAPPVTVEIESGCSIYDTPYNEGLITRYYTCTGGTRCPIFYTSYSGQTIDVIATNLSGDDGHGDNYTSSLSGDIFYYPNAGVPLLSVWEGETHIKLTPSGQSEFQNGVFTIVPGSQKNERLWEILKEYRRRKRVGKLFCGGIVNYSFIDNWLSGSLYFFQFKANGSKVCDNLIKYVQSEQKYYYRSTKYDNGTWGVQKTNGRDLGRPTTMVDLGPRDEFIKEICVDPTLDPNCSVSRNIGSTSFKSFGEIMGLAINYRMDVSNNDYDINNFFKNTGFTFTDKVFSGDLLQLISINNEAGIEEFDLQSPKYLGYSYQFLDPELPSTKPVFYRNGKYGATPITFHFENDGERIRLCLNEPTHIANDGVTLLQGRLTESSQKVPFYLWDKKSTGFGGTQIYNSVTQKWEYISNQSWDYSSIQLQPLQGMTYGYGYNNPTDESSDKYLLLPITYDYSGLTINTDNATNVIEYDDVINGTLFPTGYSIHNLKYPGYTVLIVTSGTVDDPLGGTLYTRVGPALGNTTYEGINIVNGWYSRVWDYTDDFIIRPTLDYYSGNRQILSTPFLFYFGLKAGKTAINKFIEKFGDKGAFPTQE